MIRKISIPLIVCLFLCSCLKLEKNERISEVQFIKHKEIEQGFILDVLSGKIMLKAEDDEIIRVRYTESKEFLKEDSLVRSPRKLKEVSYRIYQEDGGETVCLGTDKLIAKVNAETSAVVFYDLNGNVLLREHTKKPRVMKPYSFAIKKMDLSKSKLLDTADGKRVKGKLVETGERVEVAVAEHHLIWQDDEALYGLGCHEEDMLNLRGQKQYLYQQNMKAVMPVIMSSKGYGLLYDAMCDMVFSDQNEQHGMTLNAVKELDYTFMYGPKLDQVVAAYRKVTGEVPMLPKWAFGYTQSKERYENQDEIVNVVKEFRERKIPLDLIVQDWKYWPTGWGIKEFDKSRYPDPGAMVKSIHDMNAHLMISIWPQINGEHPEKTDMSKRGFMLANGSTYNAYDPKARKAYWDYAYDGIFKYGIDGWWCDCTEPIAGDWRGKKKLSLEERYKINTEAARDILTPLQANSYSLYHSKGIYENQRKASSKRVINLTRSSYAGQQRYSTITWSGDINAKWDVYLQQISSGLGFMATGAPYWTTDIGGFFVKSKKWAWFWKGDYQSGVDDLGYRELYTRWFQFGAFLPMFRSHGTDTPREVWRFGEPGTPFYDSILNSIHLRYRLMPYIYSLAGSVTHDHYTMNRLLAFDFPEDPVALNQKYQFMFGPSILVCPVIKTMYYERESKAIPELDTQVSNYLPHGSEWYDFWTGQKIQGGQYHTNHAPISKIPLYVKAGAILPMGPYQQYTDETPDSEWEIRIYPGKNGRFKVYEDAGDGYEYEDGERSVYSFVWNDQDRKLSITERQGRYSSMVSTRSMKIILMDGVEEHGASPVRSSRGPSVKSMVYDGQAVELQF